MTTQGGTVGIGLGHLEESMIQLPCGVEAPRLSKRKSPDWIIVVVVVCVLCVLCGRGGGGGGWGGRGKGDGGRRGRTGWQLKSAEIAVEAPMGKAQASSFHLRRQLATLVPNSEDEENSDAAGALAETVYQRLSGSMLTRPKRPRGTFFNCFRKLPNIFDGDAKPVSTTARQRPRNSRSPRRVRSCDLTLAVKSWCKEN